MRYTDILPGWGTEDCELTNPYTTHKDGALLVDIRAEVDTGIGPMDTWIASFRNGLVLVVCEEPL